MDFNVYESWETLGGENWEYKEKKAEECLYRSRSTIMGQGWVE